MNEQQFHEALGKAVALSNERRKDMLTGALEGGSNYWYQIGDQAGKVIDKYLRKHDGFADTMWRALKDYGKTLPIHDREPSQDEESGKMIHKILGHISLQSIMEGEVLMAQHQPQHYADILKEHDDAETADVWFQYCVLKDVIYG